MFELTTSGLELIERVKSFKDDCLYAMSKALNDTAKDIQSDTVNRLLPSKFTLRSRGAPWWRPGNQLGFNIDFATKSELWASIGTRADFMGLQEFGGIKKPTTSANLSVEAGARPSPDAVLNTALRPRALLIQAGQTRKRGKRTVIARKDGAGFVIKDNKGSYLFTRTGPGEHDLKLMYVFEHSASIKPVLGFEANGRAIADKNFALNYRLALQKVAFDILSR